ncbi:outer membrane receptor protein involved in Fe transport [Sphingobium jiangsuense]|uniref:Outer membrane receptor protein involved in Fe transport n=1 Tax=Sphingobium jiangsuense TaxID=870476 RepID=A0A7W6FRB1_9SPHN|nr:TonB-dependent receptor [Sphingobium jiangsuense]MBB3927986.1 outer membrane receptor protein involved in Fe transport [Sphingobium jiangsuense]
MASPIRFARLLLLSSALAAPVSMAHAAALAEPAPARPDDAVAMPAAAAAAPDAPDAAAMADAEADQQGRDISIPGAIIVTGRRSDNVQQAAPAVVSVLTTADIQRTGEGDIAGALSRVTGLSVMGNGFVYVRGLGDRYSSALLNGSPLPSPEPLRRVVPLDLFPTNVVASSLVQKSYSVNFPGEFGGGVINLTTKTIPTESFVTVKGGVGLDSETTGQMGYTYYGSSTDWTGFDNGNRDYTPALKAFFASGERIGDVDSVAIASGLVTGRNAVVQRNDNIPANFSAELTGGTRFDLGGAEMGVIASFGYSNKWRTREITQQTAQSADLSTVDTAFTKVMTDNRIVVNGLLGLGVEFGDNSIRWTNLYVRDTLKQASLAHGVKNNSILGADYMDQSTAWYERQLFDTQLVGEFEISGLNVDLRAAYANSQREAPYELDFEYVRTNQAADPYGAYYINLLDRQRGKAVAAFSDLNENLYSFGADFSYEVAPSVVLSAGYALSDTKRISSRREFQFNPGDDFVDGIGLWRPDFLLQPAVVNHYDIGLIETTESDPSFTAKLNIDAGYGQVQADLVEGLNVTAGVRYERAMQSVEPTRVFNTSINQGGSTLLKKDYWLPAITITYEVAPDMQLRASGSKTIARPQFRELLNQSFYDPETNRTYLGNPTLRDSVLYNGEARFEWYFARDQRFSLAGFYKKIDNPIEAYVSIQSGNDPITGYANAPEARLYGAEVELQKYFPLDGLSDGGFFVSRRAVLVANYTYTRSKIRVGADDLVSIYQVGDVAATNYFTDGDPLTGQSDHLVNLQLGLEDTDSLSQQTLLLTYASKRVTSRGPGGTPDIYEHPGFNLDFVMRQGIRLGGIDSELKLEARNLTGRKFREYQESGANRIYYNLYKLGTSVSASWSVKF